MNLAQGITKKFRHPSLISKYIKTKIYLGKNYIYLLCCYCDEWDKILKLFNTSRSPAFCSYIFHIFICFMILIYGYYYSFFWIMNWLNIWFLSMTLSNRYNFPFSPTKFIPFYGGAEFHDYHHYIGDQSQSNFGPVFTYCDYIYGTDKVY